jgi:hypothetical protein
MQSPTHRACAPILAAEEEGETVVARYAWAADPAKQAGRLRLTREGDKIALLVVTFEGG